VPPRAAMNSRLLMCSPQAEHTLPHRKRKRCCAPQQFWRPGLPQRVKSIGSTRPTTSRQSAVPPIAIELVLAAVRRLVPLADVSRCSIYHYYSITSLARASSIGGTSRPSAFAVFTLMTSSKLVACWTGRSAALSPPRILATYPAVAR
jgi:hypothetical protein